MSLTEQRIVAEAVTLLDEDGLDGVTLRKLAQRLGVQAPTLYWHLRNKAALITALAEAILAEQFAELRPPDPAVRWRDWLMELAERLRGALLAHRDGARVVSAAQLSTRMNAFSEFAMKTLVDRGLPLREARLRVLAMERFTIGHVLEEQAARPDDDALAGFDADAFAAAHPTLVAGIAEYFRPGRTVDDLFRDTLRLVIE
ncbi:TetR/AcrR family transcriptional regulator C-terminal domain-containing protein [Nocardia sp. NPDC088792]|uniref:TetR/AcrR family transcriptional regulator C-terminal domain-containing protein n=1 Tax=Nocardia sp. NPDC088792 TaxID=3364332 RepID=UPI00381A74E1